MILTTKKYRQQQLIDEDILQLIDSFISNHDLNRLELGKHIIEGDRVYANVMEYQTKPMEECMWEAHQKYLDVHYLVRGEEIIYVANISNMQQEMYSEEGDYYRLNGSPEHQVCLKPGEYLTFSTEDAHMTGCCYNNRLSVKKIVFKIRIE